MKKLLILLIAVIGILCVGCQGKTEWDGSTWTLYEINGQDVNKYVESQKEDSVKVIKNIEIKGDKAILYEYTYSNKKGLEVPSPGGEGTTVLSKGDAVVNPIKEKCKSVGNVEEDGKFYVRAFEINGKTYKIDTDAEIFTTILKTDDAKYVCDYGITGKIFSLDKAYKDDKLIFDMEKDSSIDEEFPNNIVSYSFSLIGGNAREDDKGHDMIVGLNAKNGETKVELEYDGIEENGVYDRKTKTLTVENNGIKRVYVEIGTTPLRKG